MSRGELLTKLTIWLSVAGYTMGLAGLLVAGHDPRWRSRARWAWTFGCALLLAHIFCAFRYYHHWSHTAAYLETARQTNEVVKLNWGGGIFVNYLFAAAWVGDVLWWWLGRESYERRSRLLTSLWHGFFAFMIFNGTVVFASGGARRVGLALCLGLGLLWWITRPRYRMKPL